MADEGRDERGRFAKGNPGGPGRPKRRTERELMCQLMEVCSHERLEAVFMRLVADAVQGKPEARQLLLEYLMGKPGAKAPSLSQIAVDEESGVDPLAMEILLTRSSLL